jgi:Fusaric acid resistance protein-like
VTGASRSDAGRTTRLGSRLLARLRLAADGFDRAFFLQAFKITVSATVAWLLAKLMLPHATPIYAPITACFIAVATVRATFTDAVQRTVAVVTGIGLAYGVGSVLGLQVWTIALVTAVGTLVGRALRLPRGAAAQVPISGLLIMAIGATPGHAGERVLETVTGVAVSIVINLVIAPPNHVTAGSRAVGDLVAKIVASVEIMAAGVGRTWTRTQAADWLTQARTNRGASDLADEAVTTGADSLRLRPKSAQHAADQARIDVAMDTLRVVEVQVRVVGRSLRDTADALADAAGTLPPLSMGSSLLSQCAAAVTAFGEALLGRTPEVREAGRARTLELIVAASATASAINADLVDMTAASLTRGLHLGALVIEAGRVLDELKAGLDRAALPAGRH